MDAPDNVVEPSEDVVANAKKEREAKRNPFSLIALFIRQVFGELRKVVTPTRKELFSYTGVVLVFVIISFGNTPSELGPLAVALLVVGIGASLGGPTGYAINPARDLGPRIAHAVLPIPGKGSSGWWYAWVPVAGPVVGGVLGGLVAGAVGYV